jgi:3-phosphoshikimate 1-carboxyvinyltransferase
VRARAAVIVQPARRFEGRLSVPGDKSVSHRALLLAALARGRSRLENLGPGDDCRSTRACLDRLGVSITDCAGAVPAVVVEGRGLAGFAAPSNDLDAGNSGTTTRLLLGVLAAHAWSARVVGDPSLQRRPMRRIIEPLVLMGAAITSADGCLPIEIRGGALRAIDYAMPVASAQVKSGILLAGLHADGITTVRESTPTRDHTERAFAQFGARVDRGPGGDVSLRGGQSLEAVHLIVPGDPSSAAFWAVAAAALPGSDVTIEGVCLNPTRTGFLDVLRRAGARIETTIESTSATAEPVGTIRVRHDHLQAVTVEPYEVPGVIDELPVLAALATFGGAISVSGASELRVKESDRIAELVRGLRALGAAADERPDGFTVDGRRALRGGLADAAGDHRLAMAFAIAALGADSPSQILGADSVSVSYPGFFAALEGLRYEGR